LFFDDAQALLITIFQKFALSFYVVEVLINILAVHHIENGNLQKMIKKKTLLINLVLTTSWTKNSRTFQGYSRRQFQYTFHVL